MKSSRLQISRTVRGRGKASTSIYDKYAAAGGCQSIEFGTQKTMRIAQQLYEGVDIKGNGTVGVITYLRTDSTRISEEADSSKKLYC